MIRLGKPFGPMFEEAKFRLGSHKLLMIGDQIYTDIKGARAANLPSLLVGSGLTHIDSLDSFPDELHPDYYIDSL